MVIILYLFSLNFFFLFCFLYYKTKTILIINEYITISFSAIPKNQIINILETQIYQIIINSYK